MFSSFSYSDTNHGDHAAGPDATAHAHQAHVVGVLSRLHEVLVSHVVVPLVDHEAAAVHPAGLAPAQVGGHVGKVAHALIRATLEVLVLVESDLENYIFNILMVYTFCTTSW